MLVGEFGTGTLTISDGGRVSNTFDDYIGYHSNSNGTVTVTGPGSTWTNGKALFVGYHGTGKLTISNGGKVFSLASVVGFDSNSNGTVTVTGSGSTWTTTRDLSVGSGHSGTLTISDGGAVSNTLGYIGRHEGSYGAVTVTGADSIWTNNDNLHVGWNGTGTLTVEEGGVVGVAGAIGINAASSLDLKSGGTLRALSSLTNWITGSGSLTLGAGGGRIDTQNHTVTIGKSFSGTGSFTKLGTGALTLTGANTYAGSTTVKGGSLTVKGPDAQISHTSANFVIGDTSGDDAALTISDGATVASVAGYIANEAGSKSKVTVEGPGSTWTNGSDLHVGFGGLGELLISDGGTVSSFSGVIGLLSSSTGIVKVEGSGSTWTNTSDLQVGLEGSGEMTIADGAGVSNAAGYIGSMPGFTGTVTVEGPASTWVNSGSLYVGLNGTGEITIADGGSVSSNAGHIGRYSGSKGTVTVRGTDSTWISNNDLQVGVDGTGALTIADGGKVTVGETLSINGSSTVTLDGGALHARHLNPASGTFEFLSGTLMVNGTITGDLAVPEFGTLGGNATITGDLLVSGTLAPGNSTGAITVEGDLTLDNQAFIILELASLTDFDRIEVNGDLTFGGTLMLDFIDGFTLDTTASFLLFTGDYTSSFGTFESIAFSASGYEGIFDYETGYLTVSVIPEPTTYGLLIVASAILIALRRSRRTA